MAVRIVIFAHGFNLTRGFLMNFKKLLVAVLMAMFSMGVVYAAGEPMNEDFTELLSISDKLLDAAKNKDITAFEAAAREGSDVAKEQGMKGSSLKVQRVSTMFKKAKKAAKEGNFDEATTVVNEAISEMKREKAAVKFGGGT
jgi:ribosomal protein S20